MQFNQRYLESLRDLVRTEPLRDDEVRRIHLAGEQYIAFRNIEVDEGYVSVLRLSIDDIPYTVYVPLRD